MAKNISVPLLNSLKASFHAVIHGRTLGVHPNVEPTHFWSQGQLVNDVRSWQLIIKHDLTHRFHGRTLGFRPSGRVPHR